MNEPNWIGTIVGGHYEIVEKVSDGEHSLIFWARNLVNGGNDAAIKVVHDRVEEPFLSDRLNREATVLGLLKGQPGCPTLLNRRFTAEGRLLLVIELLDGMTLQSMLERGDRRLTLEEVVKLFAPVIQALAALHRREIVHRNIHPGKLFRSWDPPGLKLTGFGDAHSVRQAVGGDVARLIGQPKYTAPEVWSGARYLDVRADVYSMAAVLYRCLAGRCPIEHESSVVPVGHAPKTEIPELSLLAPGLPTALDDWSTIALCPDREGRFDNIEAMWAAFLRAAESAVPASIDLRTQLQAG